MNERKGRQRFAVALLLLAVALASGCRKQGPYPNRQVELVVPFSEGDPSDVAARIIQPKLAELMGTQVAVVNRPGAGGAEGADAIVQAPVDGYQLLAATNGVLTLLPALITNPGFSMADFTPLGGYLSDWAVVAVPASSAWKTIEPFIEYARRNPGKVRFGAEGEGTASSFTMEQLTHAVGVKVAPARFSGAVAIREALLQGEIEIAAAPLSTLAPLFQSGELRPLLLTSEDRLPGYPEVPTLYEKGYTDFELGIWMALFVKAGTPKEVSDRLAAGLSQAMQDSAVFEAAERAGLTVDYRNPDATRRQLASESETIRAAVAEMRGAPLPEGPGP